MSKRSHIEQRLFWLIQDEGLPLPQLEYRFHPERKWRFDQAWPHLKLAVECEGGIWSRGRHTRGIGYIADCEKYNAAALAGWRVLRFPMDLINNGTAIETLRQALSLETSRSSPA